MTDPENPEEKVPTAPGSTEDDHNEFSPETVVGNLVKEAQENRDRLLRTLAEMENLRKRTARDVAEAQTRGITNFARDILDIADNLHRALEAVPAEARSSDNSGLQALVEGVELTERALARALEKHGVRRFDPAGEKFDPNLHQAMYEVPDASVAAGTIVQVMQPGYMIGDRMLRAAMVAVAKGGAKETRQSDAEAETPQDF